MRVALLWPPPTVMDVVPVSLTSLGGVLRAHANPFLFDLGAQFQAWLLSNDRVSRALERCEALLAGRARPWADDLAELQRVLAREAVVHADVATRVDATTAALRSADGFAGLDQERAQDVLLRAGIILSAAHLPVMLLPNRSAALLSREHARAADVPEVFALLAAHCEHDPALADRTWEERFAHSEDSVFHRFLDGWLAPRLAEVRPDLIAVTLFSFEAPPFGLALLRWLRRRMAGVPVVAGGATLSRAFRFARLDRRFDCFSAIVPGYADAVAVGEGETALLAVCEAVATGRPLGGLPSVVAPDASGRLVWPEATTAHRFEELPPPSLATLDLSPYLVPSPALVIPTARNCNYRCHFCGYNSHEGQPFVEKPPELVVRDMQSALAEAGIATFLLGASNHRPVWLRRLAEAIRDARLDVAWEVQCVLTPGVDEAFGRLLRAGGCRKLHFGIESGSARLRGLMNKPMSLDNDGVVAAVAALTRAGVEVVTNFMVGHPGELPADRQASEEIIERLLPFVSEVALLVFYPEPASWLVLRAEELGVRLRFHSLDGRIGHFEPLVVPETDELIGPTPDIAASYEARRELVAGLLERWGSHFGHVRDSLVSRHNQLLIFGSFLWAARRGLVHPPVERIPRAVPAAPPLEAVYRRNAAVRCERVTHRFPLAAVHLGDPAEPDAMGTVDYALLVFPAGQGPHLCVQPLVAELWESLDGRRSLATLWAERFGAAASGDEAALLSTVAQAMLERGLIEPADAAVS